jgi:phosphoribosyl 1,2-cyclic phosphate phosphodiesterase
LVVTFLGTGTSHGVPMIGCECGTCRSTDPRDQRTRPSILVRLPGGGSLLVDAGPDLRAQALRHGVTRVDAILFTHGHADHILGLDDVRRFNSLMGRAMPLLGDALTLDEIRRMFGYVFDPATPKGGGLPQLALFAVGGPFCIAGQEVVPIPLWHAAARRMGARRTYFTHMCHDLPHAPTCARLPAGMTLAYDGLEIAAE